MCIKSLLLDFDISLLLVQLREHQLQSNAMLTLRERASHLTSVQAIAGTLIPLK